MSFDHWLADEGFFLPEISGEMRNVFERMTGAGMAEADALECLTLMIGLVSAGILLGGVKKVGEPPAGVEA